MTPEQRKELIVKLNLELRMVLAGSNALYLIKNRKNLNFISAEAATDHLSRLFG